MLCKSPYMAGSIPYGCGQCLPCRVNRGRQWKWRQFLESLTHEHNCFVTLTYAPAHIPGNWALRKRDLQLFIKSLRSAIYPSTIRYFAVGEYGDTSRRPHYHLSVFGMSGYQMFNGRSVVEKGYKRGIERVVGGLVHECWGLGGVDIQEFNHVTAAYVAGYTTAKLRNYKNGFEPIVEEFSRMSTRPGLGTAAMEEFARLINSRYQNWEDGDVPSVLRVGGHLIPIGRYLLNQYRKKVGFTDEYIKEIKARVSYKKSVEMQVLLDADEGNTFKGAYLKDVEGRMRQVEEKAKRLAVVKLSRRGIL